MDSAGGLSFKSIEFEKSNLPFTNDQIQIRIEMFSEHLVEQISFTWFLKPNRLRKLQVCFFISSRFRVLSLFVYLVYLLLRRWIITAIIVIRFTQPSKIFCDLRDAKPKVFEFSRFLFLNVPKFTHSTADFYQKLALFYFVNKIRPFLGDFW